MHPWPSCNGRTRNAVRCTRPHYFYCPSPDFTTSIVSQSVQSLCPLMWGAQEKSEGGTSKKFRPARSAGIVPPTCKLLLTPLFMGTCNMAQMHHLCHIGNPTVVTGSGTGRSEVLVITTQTEPGQKLWPMI